MNELDQRQARLRHLETMLRIRFFEEEVTRCRLEGVIVGSVHLCIGQEAICTGTCAVLDLPRDLVFPTYRGHGWAVACGVPTVGLFAELMGKESGTNGGRAGSALLSSPKHGFYGENSIVGAGTPIASGAALAGRFDGSNRVTVAVIGEGAMNQGAVHEAMNFASVKNLPVIFMVENNRYSELTPSSAMVRKEGMFKRGTAYGIKSVRIDGNDVEKVETTLRQAVEAARAGEGPFLIEATTERLVGHYLGDAQVYRQPGELDAARHREPIVVLEQKLRMDDVDQKELDALRAKVFQEIQTASAEAQKSPIAESSTVMEHLYG